MQRTISTGPRVVSHATLERCRGLKSVAKASINTAPPRAAAAVNTKAGRI